MTLKFAERAYLARTIRMAQSPLENVNLALTRDGHDAQLAAEAEGLVTQIASLEVELREAQA